MKTLYQGKLGPFSIEAVEVRGEVTIRAWARDGQYINELSYRSMKQAPGVMMQDLRAWAESRMMAAESLSGWRFARDFLAVFDDTRFRLEPPLSAESWEAK